MTDPNGWPDAAKPGYPLNPKRRGAHAIAVDDDVWVSRWESKTNTWDFGCTGTHIDAASFAAHCAKHGYRYLGPMDTPAEVAALIEAARREEREANIRLADMYGTGKQGMATSAAIVAAIRARGDA